MTKRLNLNKRKKLNNLVSISELNVIMQNVVGGDFSLGKNIPKTRANSWRPARCILDE